MAETSKSYIKLKKKERKKEYVALSLSSSGFTVLLTLHTNEEKLGPAFSLGD